MGSRRKVKAEDFGDGISAIIDHYIVELRNASEKDVRAAARVSRKELTTTTPPGAEKYRDWTDYQEGWRTETKKDGYGNFSATVKNKKSPGLTHLLEKGHIMADGKSSKAYPHIKPAGDKGVEELRRRVKK